MVPISETQLCIFHQDLIYKDGENKRENKEKNSHGTYNEEVLKLNNPHENKEGEKMKYNSKG